MTRLPFPSMPRRAGFTALLAAGLLAAGCASQPDRYYTLATPPGTAAETAPSLFVELAPVALPERLARPQMVVRDTSAGAQVRILERHRWSASFEKELRDALAAGVVERSGAIDVSKGARQAGQPVWRIAVQLREFDAVEGSHVEAAFGWTLRRSDAPRTLHCSWQAREAAPGGAKGEQGIEAIATAARQITSRASQALARQLAALQADPAAACVSRS